MKLAKIKNRIKSVVMASALGLALLAGFPAVEAQAATGSVYTCTINRCYAHPVTGVVEDSGGAGSYATGQGMVEGCVYPTGILEVSDDGNYYLTIRMSLMDYTSGHDFQVQSVGDSGWSSTGYAQTGTGSDSNGTTADVVIQVPSENCIVRGTMYVEPMGRNVVFYLYPSDYKEGNNTDMNATIVTGSAASNGTAAESSSDGGSAALEILLFRVQEVLHPTVPQAVRHPVRNYRAVYQKQQSQAVNRKLRVRTAVHWTVQKD